MRRFTTTLHHNGVFIQNPLKYVHGETYVIKDINFEGMSVNQLREIIDRLKKWVKIDLYVEHHGYDVMAMVRDDNFPMPNAHLVEDHADEEECVTIPDFIDVQVESDDGDKEFKH
ncbi:hypothetical protein Tco_1522216 [Tanacetum coccineum]